MASTQKTSQMIYEIKVQGVLDQSWEVYFKGLTVTPGSSGEQASSITTLVGPMIDQSALRGLPCVGCSADYGI